MSSGNNKRDGNERKPEKTANKKQVKHDPQAESARTKFGKDKEA